MTLILSLDDDDSNLTLLGIVLEYAGYEHIATTDEDEALSLLKTQSVDLFTQDILRPKIPGLDFYRTMKADDTLRDIPVLFITAVAQPTFAEECRSVYGDDYLAKPFNPAELMAAVTGILTRRGKHIPTDEERAAKLDQFRAKYPGYHRSGR